MINLFFTLFRPGESTCFARNIFDTKVQKVIDCAEDTSYAYFSLNPIKEGHTRRDDSVECYRNFLIEMDQSSIEEQKKHLKDLNIPYTSVIFSGNKSLHVIISLDTEVSKEMYKALYVDIHRIVKIADTKCRNPSRLTRFPNHERDDTGNIQELVELKQSVKLNDLLDWVKSFNLLPLAQVEHMKPIKNTDTRWKQTIFLSKWTQAFLRYGASKNRNNALYCSTLELRKIGFDRDEIWNRIKKPALDSGLDIREIEICFNSAMRRDLN